MQGEAMPCHEQPDANKNACLVHCSQSDQISADQAGPLFMHARNAVLVLDVPAVPAAIPLRFGIAQAARNLGPSIPIRFCTFLI